jgi:hypothetical protein
MHQNYSHHLWLQIAPVCLFITGWGNAYWCSRFLEPALMELSIKYLPRDNQQHISKIPKKIELRFQERCTRCEHMQRKENIVQVKKVSELIICDKKKKQL